MTDSDHHTHITCVHLGSSQLNLPAIGTAIGRELPQMSGKLVHLERAYCTRAAIGTSIAKSSSGLVPMGKARLLPPLLHGSLPLPSVSAAVAPPAYC